MLCFDMRHMDDKGLLHSALSSAEANLQPTTFVLPEQAAEALAHLTDDAPCDAAFIVKPCRASRARRARRGAGLRRSG